MGECLWVPFFGAVPQNAGGDVLWEGASGEAPEALFELVRALAGAEAVSHEVRRGRRYDVYIRNDLSGPRVTEVGNVILHVNSDAGHGRAPQPPKPPAGLGRRGLPRYDGGSCVLCYGRPRAQGAAPFARGGRLAHGEAPEERCLALPDL